METLTPPHPAIDLSTRLYYQVVHTLTGLLPPPPDDTPETLLTRNHAAVAKVAALLPVNANEADLAAQCIASRAQAEELLRLLRQYAGDIGLLLRLNAQYGSMVRTSLSVHARLMRVQALRHKREANEASANQDAWTLHLAERSMLGAADPDAGPSPEAAAVEPPAPHPDQTPETAVSENETNSQDTAFETQLSAQSSGQRNPDMFAIWLFNAAREAAVEPPPAHSELPKDDHENPDHARQEAASA